jgi:integrase
MNRDRNERSQDRDRNDHKSDHRDHGEDRASKSQDRNSGEARAPKNDYKSFGAKLADKMQQTKADRLKDRVSEISSIRNQAQNRPREISTADIKSAREHIKGWKPGQVRDSTQARYAALSERMQRTGKTPEQIAGTKQSFYTYRAALVHEARTELRTALRDRDVAARAHNPEQKMNAEARIKTHTETLTRYAPSAGDLAQDMERKSAYTGDRKSERSNGKREALDSRPADWRDRVWKEIQPRDRDAVAVTALTGVRPAELEKGVQVRNAGDSLQFKIEGAKTNGSDRGQEQRTITISKQEAAKSVEGRHLLDTVKPGQEREVKIGDAANFSDRVRHASERAMPGERTVSPYDYRHAFSARIKDDARLTQSDRAAALGQQSERSQSAYAGAGSAGSAGSGSISSASASTATH